MLDRSIFNLIPLRDKSKLPAVSWGEFKDKKYDGELKPTN